LALIGDSSVLARTKDGLLIDLQCRLLYRVQSENVNGLASLYLMFNGGYVNAYQTVARAAVRDVASEYTAFEFWRFRENITNAMFDRMSISLGDMYGQVESFLLNNFELPTRFQTAIVETDVRKQELLQVQFEEATARTETQTIILKAEKDSQIIALEADAKATAFLLSVDADIFKIQSAVQAELESYAYLAQTLNFTAQELSSFIWLDTMSKSSVPGGKVFNIQTPKSFKV
jgi:regulator of protease activity HflC (stomatin/prohibitin superfamily)